MLSVMATEFVMDSGWEVWHGTLAQSERIVLGKGNSEIIRYSFKVSFIYSKFKKKNNQQIKRLFSVT